MDSESTLDVFGRASSALRDQINAAKAKAKSIEYMDAMERKSAETQRAFMNEEIDSKELARRMAETWKDVGLIEFDNYADFKNALDVLRADKEGMMKTIDHEHDHMLEAHKQGLTSWYGIRFVDTGGGIANVAYVTSAFPEDMPDDKRREAIRATMAAPKNLGRDDRQALGEDV